MVVLDRVIGGLAPGLPLVLAGPSGCGRTVLALELAAAALRDEGIVVLLTAEPPSLLLRQAETLGIELGAAVESEQLLLLEIDPRASASLAATGGRAFGEAILAEHPAASLVLIDPFTALTRDILDEAPLRAVARELIASLPRASLVLTVETGLPGVEAPVERVLTEVCGSFVGLARDADGRRTLRVGKTRAGAGAAECVEFTIGRGGSELIREVAARPPAPAEPSPEPVRPAPTTPAEPRVEPANETRLAPTPELQVASPPEPAGPPPPDPAVPGSGSEPAGDPDEPATVLLVEDDPGLRAQLCGWLEPHHRVVTASDGLNALSALLGQRPDCIVLELGMSRITGYEVLAALHRAAQSIPILVLSQSTRRASERVGPLVLGAADVLAKPVAAFELLHKVDILLRLDGPPPRLMEPEDAMALFGSVSPTRTLAAAEFRDRLTRACDFGARFGTASTLLAVTATRPNAMDALVGVADHELRFEDAILLVSKRRAVFLLVAADPGTAPVVMERLLGRLEAVGGEAPDVRWQAFEARAAAEIGDWRSLFREIQASETAEPGEDA